MVENMNTTHTQLPDNKSKLYGGAWSVHDHDIVNCRNQLLSEFAKIDIGKNSVVQQLKSEFFSVYKTWMFEDFSSWPGLNLYNECCFTQGTTDSFAQFYLRFGRTRRLRLAKGEYFYHQMMKNLWYQNSFAWLEDADIKEGDFVMISVPFSDTGRVPGNLERILCECDRLDVPVMLDFAYLNLATQESLGLEVDLTHKCIEYIVSSLSKALPLEHFRVGIRLQRNKFEDQLYVINEDNYNYLNFCSMFLGTELMKLFPARTQFNKYRHKQIKLCDELNLLHSPCYIFGIDTKNQYPEYSRGNQTNRLCFSRIWDGRVTKEGSIE